VADDHHGGRMPSELGRVFITRCSIDGYNNALWYPQRCVEENLVMGITNSVS